MNTLQLDPASSYAAWRQDWKKLDKPGRQAFLTQLGEQIQAWRLDRSLSQDQLAQAAGLAGSGSVSPIESGKAGYGYPRIETAAGLAQALHVPLATILDPRFGS